eukprot:3637415-Prymnesium_polylepis.1
MASRAAGQSVRAHWPRQKAASKGVSTAPLSSSSSVSTGIPPSPSRGTSGSRQHGSSVSGEPSAAASNDS